MDNTNMTEGTGGRRKAVALPAIELVYRQVYDTLDSKLFGFESQIRINDKKLGTLTPSLFVPIAETSNQIVELGKWSFVEMSDMLRRQQSNGRDIPHMLMPISPKYLCKNYFLANLSRQLEKAGLPPEAVIISIEADALAQNATLAQAIHTVYDAGFRFCVCGLGETGVPLKALADLPISYMRLDASFVHALPQDERLKDIANSFAELATKLSAELIADGVESKEEVAALQSIGCSLMQGPYIGEFERETTMFG